MITASTPLPPVSVLPGFSLDAAIWDAMIKAAGPKDAVWLVRQIAVDLDRMQANLIASLAQGEPTAIRRASHALAGLGGTIGASDLHDAAQHLNEAAHRRDVARVTALGGEVQVRLAAILALVRHRLSAMAAT
jgi:HPt (histidine-containing phosphotransfer) domain-containing protein